jgi:hypothetical protein
MEWVVREGVGQGGEMTQALYAHMNNKTIKKRVPFSPHPHQHLLLFVLCFCFDLFFGLCWLFDNSYSN